MKHLKENVSKGEFVGMIFADEERTEDSEIGDKIKVLQDKGFSAKDISVIISELYKINKNKVYKIAISKQM